MGRGAQWVVSVCLLHFLDKDGAADRVSVCAGEYPGRRVLGPSKDRWVGAGERNHWRRGAWSCATPGVRPVKTTTFLFSTGLVFRPHKDRGRDGEG